MKPALIVVDMQKEYYVPQTKGLMDRAVDHINHMIPLFEERGLPVIWVQDIDDDGGVVPGTECFEVIDALKPKADAVRIHKKYGNSFNKTELDGVLRQHGIDTPVITGFCAEFCVLSTYRGAKDLDYFPIILKNGIASTDESRTRFVEDISETVTCGVLTKMLGETQAGEAKA